MNLFEIIPSGFFNCLASGSNQRIYADCIQIIYKEYEREISYRISRNRIRDAIALYLLESKRVLMDDEYSGDYSANDMAGAIIRRFLSKDVGWLEEEIDDSTYEKQIIMTEQGIALVELLNQLQKPEKEEFSSYIYNIYNTLNNQDQWKENPYIDGIKNINKNARALSKALKKLSTFIKKIIEKMVQEQTMESLTENILEYCEGNFIREYSRLTKHQNIHLYRIFIRTKLDSFLTDDELLEEMIQNCMNEEEINYSEAYDMVLDMIQTTKRFLVDDYDQIMKDIKHKINLYLQIAIGRARFIRNKDHDIKGNVERVLRYMIEDMNETGMKEDLPDDMNDLFLLDRYEFIDEGSIRFPRKSQAINDITESDMEELTDEMMKDAKKAQLKEAYNPYSKELMKTYLEENMGENHDMTSDELPLTSKRDLLASLSAVTYAKENGFNVELLDGYYEANDMLLRRFKITKEEE